MSGKGSTFRITAAFEPAPDARAAKRRRARAEPEPGAGNAPRALRILVAEDSLDNQILIRAYLKASPHELTFAEDGQAAVNAARAANFDLILMDMRMPVMDGLTAARAIRALERAHKRSPTPIIALSANASHADISRSLQAGCQAHLSKPISKSRLLAAIDEYAKQPRPEPAPPNRAEDFDLLQAICDLIPEYLSECGKNLATISEMLQSGDFHGISGIGHNLKGSGSAFGFPEITRLGADLQTAAENRAPEAVLQIFLDLNHLMLRIAAENNAVDANSPADKR